MTLAIVGVLAFDGLSLVVGRIAAADKADSAAQAAAVSYRQNHDAQGALQAAEVAAGTAEVVPNSLRLSSDGAASVSVHRVTPTLVFRYFTPLAKLADITEPGSAPAPTN